MSRAMLLRVAPLLLAFARRDSVLLALSLGVASLSCGRCGLRSVSLGRYVRRGSARQRSVSHALLPRVALLFLAFARRESVLLALSLGVALLSLQLLYSRENPVGSRESSNSAKIAFFPQCHAS